MEQRISVYCFVAATFVAAQRLPKFRQRQQSIAPSSTEPPTLNLSEYDPLQRRSGDGGGAECLASEGLPLPVKRVFSDRARCPQVLEKMMPPIRS